MRPCKSFTASLYVIGGRASGSWPVPVQFRFAASPAGALKS